MSEVKDRSKCSELHQDSRDEGEEQTSDPRKWRFALIVLHTSCFDFGFHGCTADFSARDLRAVAATDVQISAYKFQTRSRCAS
jgi:hypothetical protein